MLDLISKSTQAVSEVKTSETRPWLGFGLGLRTEHFDDVLNSRPKVDWFEVTSENFMVQGGKPLHYLRSIRELYPIVMHGVSLSIGSTDPLDKNYLQKLKELAGQIEPVWISDHLCWTGVDGINSHDLLPLPYNDEAINHVVSRIQQVQEFLGREILIENLSSYVEFTQSQMSECEFVSQVAKKSGCRLLLDVNNVYVSSRNHGFEAMDYIRGLPEDRIWQIHLAGHSDYGDIVVDTHDHDVPQAVWDLYTKTIALHGPISTMIERDDHIPPLVELLTELDLARNHHDTALFNAKMAI